MAGFTPTDLTLLLTATVWGFNFVIVKATLGVMSPFAFLGARMTLALILMMAAYRWSRGHWRLPRRDLLHLMGLGLLGSTLYQLCFISGIDRTTAGNAALILAALPVVVAAVCHWLGVDRLRPLAWCGVVLSFGGLYLVIRGGPDQLSLSRESLIGDLFLVGAVLSWAAYTVLARSILARHDPLTVAAIGSLGGVPPLVLFCLPALIAEPWRSLPPSVWPAILYSGGLSIATAYLLWNRGLQKVGSARTAVYSNLAPVIAVVGAHFLLGERLAWSQVAGAVVIFVGIALTRVRR